MKLEEGLERIRSYFANTSADQLYNDMLDCGLNEIKSWADIGVELAYSEVKAYTAEVTKIGLEVDKSYATYLHELAEAA